ncbi:MAG: LuxR C-terminal-related transcriptional regulator [Nakamurella sp.]
MVGGKAAGTRGLIGRDAELARVRAALETGRPVLVSGPPGVGKTALASAALVGERSHWGRGLASLVWRPLVPLSHALSARLTEGSTADTADLVARRIPQDVLVLDDAQFADAATLAVLPVLALRIRTVVIIRTGEPMSGAVLDRYCRVSDLEHVELAPLDTDDAMLLCRMLGADDESATRIAAATGGLPLWCVRSVDDEVGPTLVSTIAAQLSRLDVASRTVLATLGLAGRPLLTSVLGTGTGGALAAGLVVEDGDQLRPVHPLVADIAAARMRAPDRAALHRGLAGRLADPGEAARHHIAGGDRASAVIAARRAVAGAEGLTARAANVGLLAAADGTARSALEAAKWWLASGDPRSAGASLATALDDATLFPEACVMAATVARRLGDMAAASTHLTAAMTVRESMTDRVRRQLDVELLLHDGSDPVAVADLADRCAGTTEEPAAGLVGAVLAATLGDVDWQDRFRAVRNRSGDALAMEAWFTESTLLLFLGRVDDARTAAAVGADAARRAGAAGWTDVFQHELAWILALGPDPVRAGPASAMPIAARALVLSDTGSLLAASRVISSAPAGRRRDAVEAALAWAGGDDRTGALKAAAALRSRMDPVVTMVAGPVAAWTGVPWDAPLLPAGLLAEAAALTSEPETVVDGFLDAAALWRSASRRGTVRCSWAAADAAVRGDHPAATELTAAVIDEVETSGIRAFDGRVVATARRAGIAWNARRGTASHGLTAREAEVLEHVGSGLSSSMIARRLGVSVATVETHVRSAVLKLGATNRRAAAAKLA